MSGLPEHIESQIAEVARKGDLHLLEIRRRGQQNSAVLEIIVDREEGVALDNLAELSRSIGAMLDEEDEAIKGRYRLEVSTPGLDRPLQYDWQYRKNIGRLVKVLWQDAEGKKQNDIFRLISVEEKGITLERTRKLKGRKVKKDTGNSEPISFPFEQIEQVTVEPEI